MPTITAATIPSDPTSGNEDWYVATDDVVVVLDGATIRTDTGCVHGLRWYVHQLGTALLSLASAGDIDLRQVLRDAIAQVRDLHADSCDLDHPGTPSAAVGIVRRNGEDIEWLVLADITVMVEHAGGLHVEADERVSATAPEKRAACHQFPIGSPEKLEAIVAMKHDELAARNVDGGYWVASVVPEAADHALVGSWPEREVRRVAACSDGVMRCLEMTSVNTYGTAMAMLESAGPEWLIGHVRAAENADPLGIRWPRNKQLDDATAVLWDLVGTEATPSPTAESPTAEQRARALAGMRPTTGLLGASPTVDGRTL